MTEKPKAMVPKVRFRGFTDEWKQHKYGDEFERRMERNNGKYDVTRWISVAKMYFQSPDKVQTNHIDTRTYVMHKGDIAFEGHKNKQFTFGRFVENDIGNGVISELFPIYKHISPYDLNFWKYKIHIERLMYRILANAITFSGTSSNKLVEKDFLRQPVFVPNIDEQQKIGDLLKQLDATINLLQRKADQLNTLKKALLQKMFADQKHRQPELRFKGFSGDWEQRKLENLLNYERPDKYMVKNTDYTNSGIPVLTANKSFILGYSKENNSYNDVPAIIFDDFTLDSKLVNFPFLVKSSAIKILTANANNSIVFLYYLLKHTPFIQEGHARHYISIVQKTKVMIPKATAEQNELAKMFIKLQNIITLHQKKINKLKSLKKHLLQNMFI